MGDQARRWGRRRPGAAHRVVVRRSGGRLGARSSSLLIGGRGGPRGWPLVRPSTWRSGGERGCPLDGERVGEGLRKVAAQAPLDVFVGRQAGRPVAGRALPATRGGRRCGRDGPSPMNTMQQLHGRNYRLVGRAVIWTKRCSAPVDGDGVDAAGVRENSVPAVPWTSERQPTERPTATAHRVTPSPRRRNIGTRRLADHRRLAPRRSGRPPLRRHRRTHLASSHLTSTRPHLDAQTASWPEDGGQAVPLVAVSSRSRSSTTNDGTSVRWGQPFRCAGTGDAPAQAGTSSLSGR